MEPFSPVRIVVFVVFFVLSFQTSAQSTRELEEGYYVVIGVYSESKEYYAQRYVKTVAEEGYEAAYGFNSSKKYYYVYIYSSQSINSAIRRMRQTRQTTPFGDSWVFVCDGGIASTGIGQNDLVISDTPSRQESDGEVIRQDKEQERAEATPAVTDKEEGEEQASKELVDEAPVEASNPSGKNKVESLSDVKVLFNLFDASNNEAVKGQVQVIDTERAKYLETRKGGENVSIKDPGSATGKLSLICDRFGFRKQQKEINYFDPLSDSTREYIEYANGVYTVNFDLVPYRVGDIVIMYNVSFFRDAAIMRPESKYEITSLLEMMQKDPDLVIRIHGHVNGRQPGKIIGRGGSESYFALSKSNKEGFGTARDLSRQRAELIRQFLIDKGINEDRMEVKAWGGRRMLYDKLSTRADENVRVEVEILER